jgi:hypothetical protein
MARAGTVGEGQESVSNAIMTDGVNATDFEIASNITVTRGPGGTGLAWRMEMGLRPQNDGCPPLQQAPPVTSPVGEPMRC